MSHVLIPFFHITPQQGLSIILLIIYTRIDKALRYRKVNRDKPEQKKIIAFLLSLHMKKILPPTFILSWSRHKMNIFSLVAMNE